MQCATAPVTTWHNLAQRGTSPSSARRHKLRHVAPIGTSWHSVAQPGTTAARGSSPAGPITQTATDGLETKVSGPSEFPRGRVCNAVCNWVGHTLAHPGTTWHCLAQPGTARGRRTWAAAFWVLQCLLRRRGPRAPRAARDVPTVGATLGAGAVGAGSGPAGSAGRLVRPGRAAAGGRGARSARRFGAWAGAEQLRAAERRRQRHRGTAPSAVDQAVAVATDPPPVVLSANIAGTGNLPGSSRNRSSSPSSP
jgi:hypothetical protein